MKYRLNNNFELIETSRKKLDLLGDCKFLKKKNGKAIERGENRKKMRIIRYNFD